MFSLEEFQEESLTDVSLTEIFCTNAGAKKRKLTKASFLHVYMKKQRIRKKYISDFPTPITVEVKFLLSTNHYNCYVNSYRKKHFLTHNKGKRLFFKEFTKVIFFTFMNA